MSLARATRWRIPPADSFVTIAGSLYLIGEAMELLQLSPAKANNERGLNEWQGAAGSAQPTAAGEANNRLPWLRSPRPPKLRVPPAVMKNISLVSLTQA